MDKWKILEGVLIPFLIAFVWWIWRECKKFFKKWYSNYREAENQFRKYQLEQNDVVVKQLEEIKKEFKTNGGSSLKDDLAGLKKDMNNMKDQLISVVNSQRLNREVMGEANWESDREGLFKYVSTALCEIIGCSQVEMLDNSWIGFVDPEHRKRVMDEWTDSVKMASEFNMEFNYRRTDGSFQRVRATAVHIKDEKGHVKETLGRITKVGEPFKK